MHHKASKGLLLVEARAEPSVLGSGAAEAVPAPATAAKEQKLKASASEN